jgi:RNA polymerase sigma factor (sigma-70 family)
MSDNELLRAFAADGSAQAFGELVTRHLPVVLAAARRRLYAPHLAEDVAQQVFTRLAARASRLAPATIIPGWLYRTACRIADETNRGESRRQKREETALAMIDTSTPAEMWRTIEPLLDDAMASLPETDRDAVVMRYFEDRSLREVGAALGASDDAAQKRLARALEKLRAYFAAHGRQVGAGALASAITAGAAEFAPPTLAASITSGAIAGAAAFAGAGSATIFTMSTLKSIVLGGVALAAGAGLVVEQRRISSLAEENAVLRAQTAELTAAPAQPPAAAATNNSVDPEILRLRGEVARLRVQEKELLRLRGEITALRGARSAAADNAAQASADTEEEMRKVAIDKMTYEKNWALALILYASEHEEQLPKTLDDAAKHLPDEAKKLNYTTDQIELVAQGDWTKFKNPAGTILLRERPQFTTVRPDGSATRAYAFLDGHSEIHKADNGDFTAWEAEHMPKNDATPGAADNSGLGGK